MPRYATAIKARLSAERGFYETNIFLSHAYTSEAGPIYRCLEITYPHGIIRIAEPELLEAWLEIGRMFGYEPATSLPPAFQPPGNKADSQKQDHRGPEQTGAHS